MITDNQPDSVLELDEIIREETICQEAFEAITRDINPSTFEDYFNHLYPTPMQPSVKKAKKDVEKSEGITIWKIIWSWLSRSYRKELELKRAELAPKADKVYEQRIQSFYKEQQERSKSYDRMEKRLLQHNPGEITDYFRFVLESDRFSVNGYEDYEIVISYLDYDLEKKELRFEYRVPSIEELPKYPNIDRDKKTGGFVYKGTDVQKTKKRRIATARAVLIRAISTIFFSDVFDSVDVVTVDGIMCYFDVPHSRNHAKPVMEVSVRKNMFKSAVSVNELEYLLTEQYQAKESTGLYVIEPHRLNEPKLLRSKNDTKHPGKAVKNRS